MSPCHRYLMQIRSRKAKTSIMAICICLAHATAYGYTRNQDRRITLLRLTDDWQSVGVSYHFGESRSKSDGNVQKETEHNFEENYRIGSRYSLFNPRLWRGSADLGVSLAQDLEKSSTTGSSRGNDNKLTYQINGILLDRMPYPVTFSSDSTYQRIKRPFSSSYYLETDHHSVGVNLRNRFLPVSLNYYVTTYETDGLNIDRHQTSETLSASASHAYKISSTTLRVNSTESKTRLEGSDREAIPRNTIRFDAANSLAWDKGLLSRRFDTGYVYEKETDDLMSKSSGFSENIRWELGKALESRIRFHSTNSNTESSRYKENSGSFTLIHHLFESLTTSVTGSASETNFSDGNETSYGGGIALGYEKNLPANSHLSATYTFSEMITDRDRVNVEQLVIDEIHLVPAAPPFDFILPLPQIVPESIVVKDNLNPIIVYRQPQDFIVEQIGALTRITVQETGAIFQQGVTELRVSYAFLDTPRVKYSTQSHSVSLILSLFERKHLIYSRTIQSDQDPFEGDQELITLTSSGYYELGYERNLDRSLLGVRYVRNRSTFTDSNDVEGYWRHQVVDGAASLFIDVNDRYSWYGSSAGAGHADENFLRASTRYRRPIFRRTQLAAALDFTDRRSGGGNSDRISFGIDLRSQFGSTIATVSSSSDWLFTEKNDSFVQSILLSLYRFF